MCFVLKFKIQKCVSFSANNNISEMLLIYWLPIFVIDCFNPDIIEKNNDIIERLKRVA